MSIVVPHDQLRPETLQAVIEEFVTRDGAVHGHADTSLQAQVETVRAQLESGRVVIVFDDETESCTICPADEFRKTQRNGSDPAGGSREAGQP